MRLVGDFFNGDAAIAVLIGLCFAVAWMIAVWSIKRERR